MKKAVGIGVLVVIVIASLFLSGVLSVHIYTSSPGFVTPEYSKEFYRTVPTCHGVRIPLNSTAAYADAPERSMCIGQLK